MQSNFNSTAVIMFFGIKTLHCPEMCDELPRLDYKEQLSIERFTSYQDTWSTTLVGLLSFCLKGELKKRKS